MLKWYLLTLTSGILEYKLLHIYFSVTEKFDRFGKITGAALLACGWKCVCHISVQLEVGHDKLPLAQSFWHKETASLGMKSPRPMPEPNKTVPAPFILLGSLSAGVGKQPVRHRRTSRGLKVEARLG